MFNPSQPRDPNGEWAGGGGGRGARSVKSSTGVTPSMRGTARFHQGMQRDSAAKRSESAVGRTYGHAMKNGSPKNTPLWAAHDAVDESSPAFPYHQAAARAFLSGSSADHEAAASAARDAMRHGAESGLQSAVDAHNQFANTAARDEWVRSGYGHKEAMRMNDLKHK